MTISTAVDLSAVARVVGVKTNFVNLREGAVLLPQRVAVIAQGNTAATYSLDRKQFFNAVSVGETYGFGSPAYLAAREFFPANNDGIGTIPFTIYPLADGTTAAVGDLTPSGGPQTSTEEYVVKVNNIQSEKIVIPKDTVATAVIALIVAAVNAEIKMPVVVSDGTTKVDFTAKWKGASGNDLFIEIIGPAAGITYAITQPTGGAGNPDVQDALDKVGTVWETLFLNCLDIADTTALDKFNTFGEAQWGPLVKRPCIFFSGTTEKDVMTATALPDARKLDRINSQLVAPDSNNLPFVVAARELARIAKEANENPPVEYAGQQADGIVPGADTDQWTYAERDYAVKHGSSTIEVVDNTIELSDTVTFYHKSGEDPPAYRYVSTIIKIMNVTFNTKYIFESSDWKGKVLLPNGQASTNPAVRRPSTAVAAWAVMFDELGLAAIISDPEFAKSNIQAQISSSNPNRLDMSTNYKVSGNVIIISIDQNFGFYFGPSSV